MSQSASLDEPRLDDEAIVRPKKKKKRKTKRQPPYAVILHNDSHNGMEFVVGVLKKVFGFSTTQASWYMMKAHVTGAAQVWSGALEVAELKADQLRSSGPDPNAVRAGAGPLSVSLEPLK